MKKWTIPLLALFLTACAFTPFLWQQERDHVFDAQIDKMGDDRYYITTYKWSEFEVFELNAAGDLQHLSTIPLVGYGGLNTHWIDDDKFFIKGSHGDLALVSLQNGVLWEIDEEQFESLIGIEGIISLSPSFRFHVSDDGIAFLLGNVTLETFERQGFIAQVSQTGEITSVITRDNARSVSFKQFLDDSYLVEWLEYTDAATNHKVLQKISWNGEIELERIIGTYEGLALATAESYFLIDPYAESPTITAYDWNQQELYQFSPSESIANKYNIKMKLSADSNLFIYNSSKGIEKRSANDGSLIWTKTFDKSTNENDIRISDNGVYSRVVKDFKVSVSGVTIKVDRDENGNVLLSGNKTFNVEDLISYEVGSLASDLATNTVKTTTQQGAIIFYDFEHCLFGGYSALEVSPNSGCGPETKLKKQGSIEVFDYELLEDGGLITLTSYAKKPDDPDGGDAYLGKFLITRYQ